MKSLNYALYRFKYLFGKSLQLKVPVDISLELSSFCNMHCTYCKDPETPILMSDLKWRRLGDVEKGDKVVAFDEFAPDDGLKTTRKMRLSEIENVWEVEKESLKIITDKGDVICSLDHKFLMKEGARWREAGRIKPGQLIQFATEPWQHVDIKNVDYIRGYLMAITIGDATARWRPTDTCRGAVWWRLAVTDREILDRVELFLGILAIPSQGIKPFTKAKEHYKDIEKIEVRKKSSVTMLYEFLFKEVIADHTSFEKGYLAGIFDAEGTALHGVVRISQKKENDVCEKTMLYLKRLGFDSVREKDGVRLLGGRWEILRFFGSVQPAVTRQKNTWIDTGVYHDSARVLSVEFLGFRRLIDIQTSTKTFYGNGFASHNCYHADKKNLPFKMNFMSWDTAKLILTQAADLGVSSVKMNWRGESTMNQIFPKVCKYAKSLATRSTFIDRLTNSNFKFCGSKEDIFEALACQTKVKVSYDSFKKDVFELQRAGGDHEVTTRNIDKFYNWPKRKTEIVIQAVRTQRNKDEDFEGEIKKRWPSASLSVRDVVEGRLHKNIDDILVKKRDTQNRQSCLQAHARLIFDSNGCPTVCCPDIKNQLSLGSIHDTSLYELFNSQKAIQLRKDLKSGTAFLTDPCKNCSSHETYKGYRPAWTS